MRKKFTICALVESFSRKSSVLTGGLAALILITVLFAASVFPSETLGAEASMETVLAEAERGGYRLITTEELWDRYRSGDEDMLIVDTRQGWEYRSGYIKGAVSFPMEPTWCARWKERRALGRLLGPDKDRSLVFY